MTSRKTAAKETSISVSGEPMKMLVFNNTGYFPVLAGAYSVT